MVDCLENTCNAFPLAPLPGGPLHLPLTLSLALRPDLADRTAADMAKHEPSQDHRWDQRVEFQLFVHDADCSTHLDHPPLCRPTRGILPGSRLGAAWLGTRQRPGPHCHALLSAASLPSTVPSRCSSPLAFPVFPSGKASFMSEEVPLGRCLFVGLCVCLF